MWELYKICNQSWKIYRPALSVMYISWNNYVLRYEWLSKIFQYPPPTTIIYNPHLLRIEITIQHLSDQRHQNYIDRRYYSVPCSQTTSTQFLQMSSGISPPVKSSAVVSQPGTGSSPPCTWSQCEFISHVLQWDHLIGHYFVAWIQLPFALCHCSTCTNQSSVLTPWADDPSCVCVSYFSFHI